MPFLIHLHGYNSSPGSLKALQTEQWLQQHAPEIDLVCPLLSPYPLEAIDQIESVLRKYNEAPIGIVGSSMGGFLATWIAEKYHLKAVLINPAVNPHLLIAKKLGLNTNYHTGETFVLQRCHVEEFSSLEMTRLKNPQNLMVLLQTGDEVLDYREAEKKYHDCHLKIEQGGDHGFQNYPQHLPDVIRFLQA